MREWAVKGQLSFLQISLTKSLNLNLKKKFECQEYHPMFTLHFLSYKWINNFFDAVIFEVTEPSKRRLMGQKLEILVWFVFLNFHFYKKIVERRHSEPIKFIFLPKMGLLGSQADNEKKNAGCELWATCFHGQIYFLNFFLHCKVCTKKLLDPKVKYIFF